MSTRRSLLSWPVALVGIMALAVFGGLSSELGEGFAIPVMLTLVIGTTIVLRGPVGKALARRLEGESGQVAGPPGEELLLELDDLRARVLELEERVDFSERLLAQGRNQSAEQAR